ncbi:hypothetical protein LTR37_016837 [Vermiconidia calcicola]|uniref:Uncharacterized protein n=1 Tax=Vermiconidia calcicola TaxID=1690605 RepID=A0ACC3MMI2_9PEZI|nr:hypothetical protein LTR37_016837 [Vermiconidia calcicola]
MPTGFDELVEQLLYDVALSGATGIGAEELTQAVKAFYESQKQPERPPSADGGDLLFSDAPPVTSAIVDDSFIDAVWDWLENHPDIEIQTIDKAAQQSAVGPLSTSSSTSRYAGQRIFTNEERVWHVIAGHGVDHSRIPPKQFELLSVIAAHGPEGVLQGPLRNITGQQKQSVPHRTDLLAEHGYIVKETVIAKGCNTSLLKLRRFAMQDSRQQRVQAHPDASTKMACRKIAYYNIWFDGLMRLLKANDNIIGFTDLFIGMGIYQQNWETRRMRQCIQRLTDVGCVRKLTARVEDETASEKERGKWMRCLQLLREPTQKDRASFISTTKSAVEHKMGSGTTSTTAVLVQDESSDEDAEHESDDDDVLVTSTNRVPPQYTPDFPNANLIFNIINNAGPDGISSTALSNWVTGTFWRRPFEEIMLRLTEKPELSQPPHLRHLGVVKDTVATAGRSQHRYRTTPHFETAVARGEAEWPLAMTTEDGRSKGKGKGKQKAVLSSARRPDLDEWGFPILRDSLFAGRDGRASLSGCQLDGRREAGLVGEHGHAAEDRDPWASASSTPRKKRGPKPGWKRLLPVTESKRTTTDNQDPLASALLTTPEVPGAKRRRLSMATSGQTASESPDTRAPDSPLPDQSGPDSSAVAPPTTTRKKPGPKPGWRRQLSSATPGEVFAATQDPAAHKQYPSFSAPATVFAKGTVPDSGKRRLSLSTPTQTLSSELQSQIVRPKRNLDPNRTPKPLVKIRTATENDQKAYEIFAKRMAQMLAQAEINRKTTATQAGPDDAEAELSDKITRISQIETELLSRTKPGVYINPPGAKDLKVMNYVQVGRPKKAIIAAFKSEKLRGYSWFKTDKARIAPRASRPSTKDIRIELDSAPAIRENDATDLGSRKRQREDDGKDVPDDVTQPPTNDLVCTSETPTLLPKRKKKRGRPSKAEVEERERLTREIFGGANITTQVQIPIDEDASTATAPVGLFNVARSPDVDAFATGEGTSTIGDAAPCPQVTSASPGTPVPTSTETVPPSTYAMEPATIESGMVHPAHRSPSVSSVPSVEPVTPVIFDSAAAPKDTASNKAPLQSPIASVNAAQEPIKTLSAAASVPADVPPGLPTSFSSAPLQPLAASTSSPPVPVKSALDTSSLPKKRGRPSKAMLEERERARREQEKAGTVIGASRTRGSKGQDGQEESLVVKLALGTSLMQQQLQGVAESGRRQSSIVKLSLPRALLEDDVETDVPAGAAEETQMVANAEDDSILSTGSFRPSTSSPLQLDLQQASSTAAGEDSSQFSGSRPSLIAKLAFNRPLVDATQDTPDGHHDYDNEVLRGPAQRRESLVAKLPMPRPLRIANTASRPEESAGGNKTSTEAQVQNLISPIGASTLSQFKLNIVRPYLRSTNLNRDGSPLAATQGAPLTGDRVPATDAAEAVVEPRTDSSGAIQAAVVEREVEPLPANGRTKNTTPTPFQAPVTVMPDADDFLQTPLSGIDPIADGDTSPLDQVSHMDEKLEGAEVDVCGTLGLHLTGIDTTIGAVTSDTPAHRERRETVMQIMRSAGGAFPGGDELWYPYASLYQKLSKPRPDKRTVGKAINGLITLGTLKRFKFCFEDADGQDVERYVLTTTKIATSSSIVLETKEAIIDSYPNRYLPTSVAVEEELRNSANRGRSGRAHRETAEVDTDYVETNTENVGMTTDDEDATYTPQPPTAGRNQGFLRREYPTAVGVTVKRTAEGKALADSEAQLLGYPNDKARPTTLIVPRRRLLRNIKLQDEEKETTTEDESGDDSDDDGQDSKAQKADERQLAMQHDFQLEAYVHDPKAVVDKMRHPRPRTTLTLWQPCKAHLALFTSPDQAFFSNSGTFGTVVPSKYTKVIGTRQKRRAKSDKPTDSIKTDKLTDSIKAASTPDWNTLQSPPTSLADLLKRAEVLGHPPAEASYSRLYQFSCEADRVSAVEQLLAEQEYELAPLESGAFINHGLNCRHFLDPATDNAKHAELEFVEGGKPTWEAEKEVKSRRRKDASERKKSARASKPSIRSVATTSPFLPQSSNLTDTSFLSTPQPGTSTADAAQPVPPGRRYVYETRYKGEGRPRLQSPALSESYFNDEHTPEPARRAAPFGSTDIERLHVAVALTRALCSGMTDNPKTKWELVAHALDFKYDAKSCQQKYNNSKKKIDSAALVNRLQQALYEPFLEAYEKGELPGVNFANLEETDWPALVSWVEKNVLPLDGEDQLQDLPAVQQALNNSSRTAVSQKAVGSDGVKAVDTVDENFVLEKSWIRAVVCTPDHAYNAERATEKLSTLCGSKIDKIIAEMVQSKILAHTNKGRQRPGRNYHIAHHTVLQFKRWPGSAVEKTFLRKVATARKEMIEHFEKHETYEMCSGVTEPQLIVLTNMVAQGHLRTAPIVPERCDDFEASTSKLNKWGAGGYSNKQTDSASLHFAIAFTKTSNFKAKHHLRLAVPIPKYPPAVLGEPGFRIPFWVDIHGHVIDHVWDMILHSVLHYVVYKPGITAMGIEKAHDGKLWAWEIELMLKWMENVGSAVKFGAGNGGWRAGEWWYCGFLPEVAAWKAPAGDGDGLS